MDFVKENGITTEDAYSYASGSGTTGKCNYNKATMPT